MFASGLPYERGAIPSAHIVLLKFLYLNINNNDVQIPCSLRQLRLL